MPAGSSKGLVGEKARIANSRRAYLTIDGTAFGKSGTGGYVPNEETLAKRKASREAEDCAAQTRLSAAQGLIAGERGIIDRQHCTFVIYCTTDGEATLARLRPDGQFTVAPAGGTRMLWRSGGAGFAKYTLQGTWLGLTPPDFEDQRTWFLSPRDELVLGSDGLFDQIGSLGWLDAPWPIFTDGAKAASLFDEVHQVLQEALRLHPQIDDITMVMVRKVDKTGDSNAAP